MVRVGAVFFEILADQLTLRKGCIRIKSHIKAGKWRPEIPDFMFSGAGTQRAFQGAPLA
jgi:hypothetical protein